MKPLARYASLNRYVDLCRTVDVDAVALMRSVGLSPASLANPDQWVPAASIASLLERSAAESGHEDFGLLLAGLRRLSNLGPLSLVIREEPDVRSALDVLMRYEHTYNESLRIRLNEVNGLATLRISLEVGEPVDTRQSVELAVGATLQILRSFLGSRWQPVSVGFTHNAPKDTSTHRRILGETVEFDHEFTGIVFFAADLDAANQLSDELLRPYARQFLDSLPASETSDTLSRTKELIEVLLPTGRCSVEQVARSLGFDRRTLHRHLAESGDTFTAVLNSVRSSLAERFVSNPRYSLTEVAVHLGFSTQGSFSRWFRTQFSMSRARGGLSARSADQHDSDVGDRCHPHSGNRGQHEWPGANSTNDAQPHPQPSANIAAANSAVCTVFASPRSSSGKMPVERKPMQPMNATANNGISGGRLAAVLSTILRCRILRNAMTGANINTRASFTTVATPNAVAPRALPAATTCATSWIDPPAHMPAPTSFIPKALANSGIVGIIRVPKITTNATAVSNSSSRAFTTPSAAATAAAPQIEKPQAIRILCDQLNPRSFPAYMVPAIPRNTIATTTAITPQPKPTMSENINCSPSRAIPTRSSRFAENARPGWNFAGKETVFANTAPATIAISNGLTAEVN